jgi:hypothetical protein
MARCPEVDAMKLHDFMVSEPLCGKEFQSPTWAVHREVIARLWDGEPDQIPNEYQAIACQLLGTAGLPPAGRPDELYLAFGRRSGKTRFEAVAAVHAWAESYSALVPGEWATISCHCTDKRQARTWFEYCKGLIEGSAMLSAEVGNVTAESIESKHMTRLEVFTSNYRSARGYSMPLAIIDEAAFLRDEFSAQPDIELRRALMPALATLNGRLLVASSLHRRTGLMYDQWRKYHGKAA